MPKVRDITVTITVDDDGPADEFYGDAVMEVHPDNVVAVTIVSSTVRDATEDECESMCWDVNTEDA